MVIYYALGGGLGHLSRAKKVLMVLNIQSYKVITASPNAALIFDDDKIVCVQEALSKAPDKLFSYILKLLACENAHTFMVDTFPNGIVGELNLALLQLKYKCCYIARYLNWGIYNNKYTTMGGFHKTYIVDHLNPEQESYVNSSSQGVHYLTLASKEDGLLDSKSLNRPSWLIAHSGPAHEVEELVAYAQDIAVLENAKPSYLIASPLKIKVDINYQKINQYPINHFFSNVDKIISACGFNIMLETQPYRNKHHFMPFPRKYDDQFFRSKLARQ